MAGITSVQLRSRPKAGASDKWVSDQWPRGQGSLWARVAATGVQFYFRYTDSTGAKRAVAVGAYDESGAKGLKLDEARAKARDLSKLYQGGVKDIHAHLKAQEEAAKRQAQAEEQARIDAAASSKLATLTQLISAYLDQQEKQGKRDWKDARSIFTKHILKGAPALAARRASELTSDDLVGPINAVVVAGKGRTAGKLRSYLSAAYAMALASRTDPDAPAGMRAFGVKHNPVKDISSRSLAKYNKTRDRFLSAAELGAFLRHTAEDLPPSVVRDAIQALLFLGGQRPVQLLRVTARDVDLDSQMVVLSDAKGNRTKARQHAVPLVAEALEIFERRVKGLKANDPVFSLVDYKSMRIETLGEFIGEICTDMIKAGESPEEFQTRDIRRTLETMLASLGVSRDIRAQIQSHGLSGVQNRHYDKHDYALEKKAALELLAKHLRKLQAGKVADVVDIKAGKKAQEAAHANA